MYYEPHNIINLKLVECFVCKKKFESEVPQSERPVCSIHCFNERPKQDIIKLRLDTSK
jgi:hypothetical protein